MRRSSLISLVELVRHLSRNRRHEGLRLHIAESRLAGRSKVGNDSVRWSEYIDLTTRGEHGEMGGLTFTSTSASPSAARAEVELNVRMPLDENTVKTMKPTGSV